MGLLLEENPAELFVPTEGFEPVNPDGSQPEGPPAIDLLSKYSLWAVCQTKSRREKALAHFLQKNAVPYFLPMVARRTGNGSILLNPLFPGILFVAGVPSQPPRSVGPLPKGLVGDNLYRHVNVREFPSQEQTNRLADSCDVARESTHAFGFLFTRDQARLKSELKVLAAQPAMRRTGQRETRNLAPGQTVRVRPPATTNSQKEADLAAVAMSLGELDARILAIDPAAETTKVAIELLLLGELHSFTFPSSWVIVQNVQNVARPIRQ